MIWSIIFIGYRRLGGTFLKLSSPSPQSAMQLSELCLIWTCRPLFCLSSPPGTQLAIRDIREIQRQTKQAIGQIKNWTFLVPIFRFKWKRKSPSNLWWWACFIKIDISPKSFLQSNMVSILTKNKTNYMIPSFRQRFTLIIYFLLQPSSLGVSSTVAGALETSHFHHVNQEPRQEEEDILMKKQFRH